MFLFGVRDASVSQNQRVEYYNLVGDHKFVSNWMYWMEESDDAGRSIFI